MRTLERRERRHWTVRCSTAPRLQAYSHLDKDDGFGRDDADWAVYREIVSCRELRSCELISSKGNEEESDVEEDDLAQLQSVEARLLQFDPNFSKDDTMEGRAHVKNALVNAFIRGGSELYNPDNLEHNYQLHLNVERIRVPESWFQPGMWGLDSAGLGETAGWILNSFEEEERRRMMQVCLAFRRPCSHLLNQI